MTLTREELRNILSELSTNNTIDEIKEKLQKTYPDTYQEWEKNSFDVNYQFTDLKSTLLNVAADIGKLNIVEALLEQGANVDLKNNFGNTALHSAASAGHLGVAQVLLDKGADVSATNKDGYTALDLADKNKHIWIAKALRFPKAKEKISLLMSDATARLNEFIDKEKARKSMEISLRDAVKNNNIGMIRDLIAKGVNVNKKDDDIKTPLHHAAESSNTEVAEVLLKAGADALLKDSSGQVPRNLATDKQMVQLLKTAENKQIFGKAVKAGSIYGTIAALTVGIGCVVASAGLSMLVIAGIAVAAALAVGIVAGGITYVVSKPSGKLDQSDLQAIGSNQEQRT